jgi:signal transduction histidine kinase
MAQATNAQPEAAAGWLKGHRVGLLVLLMGAALSFALYGLACRWQSGRARLQFANHSTDLKRELSEAFVESQREIEAVGRLYDSSAEVTRADFRAFLAGYLARDPGVKAVGWVPRISQAQRAGYEKSMRAEGFDGFQITQVGPKGAPVRREDAAQYFPMTYLEPSEGARAVVGFDLGSDAVRGQALQLAGATGQTQASGRITLWEEDARHCGFLLVHPVYGHGAPVRTAQERDAALRGFVVFAYQVDSVVQATLRSLRPLDISVLLRDAGEPAGSGYLTYYSGRTKEAVPVDAPPAAVIGAAFRRQSVLDVAGRSWELTFAPTPAFLAATHSYYPIGLLAMSLVLSAAVAVVHQRRTNEAERVDRLVAERTTALSRANRMLTAEVVRRQEAEGALREARDGLEQRVTERTAELTQANASLTDAVAAREKAQAELQNTNRQLEEALGQVQLAQEALVEQERMQALAQMASGIAHDFNNSLAQILGFTELLLARPEDLADRQKAGRFLEFIHAAASHAAEVVRRMRTFYRAPEVDDTELPVPIGPLIDEAIAMTEPRWKDLARARGVDVEIRKDVAETAPASGSPRELCEMLSNLLLNAVEAMTKSGAITVSARGQDSVVRLSVADTGCGMSAEDVRRCAEPFFSTKGAKGSGLGLSAVRGVVTRHGGRLSIQSEPGAGTTVTVELPVWRASQPAVAAPGAGKEPMRILLVDDDEVVGEVLEGFLRADGHTVLTVHSGRDALEKLAQDAFDLVVTDRSMPDMNGDQLVKELKENPGAPPVIMVTGFGDLMAQAGEDPTGVDLVVSKPVSMDRLRRAVLEVTARGRGH